MKKRWFQSLMVGVCGILFLSGILQTVPEWGEVAAAETKTTELSLNLVFPSTHPRWEEGMKIWVEQMEKATNGKIKVVPHFAASLAPFKDAYNAAVTGLADVTEAFIPLDPGRFPLGSATEVILVDKSTSKPGRVLWELYQAFPQMQKEFSEVKVLVLKTFAAYCLMTKKPVNTLEDLKGMKIASDSPWAVKRLNLLGATGVAMSFGEIYMALQKGVVDGVTSPETAGLGRRFFDLTKYATDVNLAGYYPLVIAMNKKKWEGLPEEIKKQIESVCGAKGSEFFDSVSIGSEKRAREKSISDFGVKYLQLSPQELVRWANIDKKVQDEFIEKMKEKNLPGEEFLQKMNELTEKYK